MREAWRTLSVVGLASVFSGMSNSALNVALPAIARGSTTPRRRRPAGSCCRSCSRRRCSWCRSGGFAEALRPPLDVPDRPGRLHRRQPARGLRPRRVVAGRLPGAAGRRRGDAAHQQRGPGHRRLPAAPARSGDGHLPGVVLRRPAARAHPRRLPRRARRRAVAVLVQRAGRHRLPDLGRRRAAPGAAVRRADGAGRPGQRARLPGPGLRARGAVAGHLVGLVEPARRRRPGGLRRPAARVPPGGAPGARPVAGHAALRGPRLPGG